MMLVKAFRNAGEAGFAHSLLESHGIEAKLEHEAAAAMLPFGIADIRLLVPQEDVEQAKQILADHPLNFTAPNTCTYFGFWQGVLFTLILHSPWLILAHWRHSLTGDFQNINWPWYAAILFLGGLIGANFPIHPRPAQARLDGE